MLKIYKVTFNDGGWYSTGGRPEFTVVTESKEKAIEMVLNDNPRYKTGCDVWASEYKIDGYVIEVYDEKSYNRDKKLEELI